MVITERIDSNIGVSQTGDDNVSNHLFRSICIHWCRHRYWFNFAMFQFSECRHEFGAIQWTFRYGTRRGECQYSNDQDILNAEI